jgi:basic amino acid/polyamine antiporter, APA family
MTRATPPRPATTSTSPASAAPRRVLSTMDGVVLVVGLVVGAGIFRTPPLVAANVSSGGEFLLVWAVGGLVALAGALCYAELASTYPHAGGEYHVLRRAFGGFVAFLLGWSRLAVLQTGSIALLAFVFADYAIRLLPAGIGTNAVTVPLLAAGVVTALTLVNAAGLRQGRAAQYAFTTAVIVGLVLVVAAGGIAAIQGGNGSLETAATAPVAAGGSNLALAFVFVLLTYGGWSEAAYLSAELRDTRRGVSRTLIWGVAAVTAIYVLANAAYLAALGFEGVRGASAVAVDVMEGVAGTWGATIVALTVTMSALSSANGTMITGARTGYAVGADVAPLAALGVWTQVRGDEGGTPRRALVAQGVVSLLLVGLGAATRAGFETMVAYTAPVFWLTLLLMGASLFILRRRDPVRPRPFSVPLFPVIPVFFCLTSAAMLWSAVAYAGRGALLGLGVMLLGIPLYLVERARMRRAALASGPAILDPTS